MSDIANPREEAEIALEYELDAPPEKLWRAIAVPAFRERWLPQADLAEPEPIASIPGVEVRYRMREDGAPFPESTVTFRIEPGLKGGALLRIIHRIEGDARRTSANDNVRPRSVEHDAIGSKRGRHCERSEAIQGNVERLRLLDRRVAIARRKTGVSRRPMAPRDDDSIQMQFALAA